MICASVSARGSPSAAGGVRGEWHCLAVSSLRVTESAFEGAGYHVRSDMWSLAALIKTSLCVETEKRRCFFNNVIM